MTLLEKTIEKEIHTEDCKWIVCPVGFFFSCIIVQVVPMFLGSNVDVETGLIGYPTRMQWLRKRWWVFWSHKAPLASWRWFAKRRFSEIHIVYIKRTNVGDEDGVMRDRD